jgi:hypothetical protein
LTDPRVDDDLLAKRIHRVLSNMALASEAPGTSFVTTGNMLNRPRLKIDGKQRPGRIQQKHHDSKAPPGTRNNVDAMDSPPDKNFSLYAHYLWRFEHAKDRRELHFLAHLAERDWDDMGPDGKARHRRSGEDGGERSRRILRDFRGVDLYEAAAIERVSAEHVRKLRTSALAEELFGARCDPRTGDPQAVCVR